MSRSLACNLDIDIIPFRTFQVLLINLVDIWGQVSLVLRNAWVSSRTREGFSAYLLRFRPLVFRQYTSHGVILNGTTHSESTVIALPLWKPGDCLREL
jgi:hypothetical protein